MEEWPKLHWGGGAIAVLV